MDRPVSAAAWKLAHRYPQMYGKTVEEHTGEDGGPVSVSVLADTLTRGMTLLESLRHANGHAPTP